jgi:hypothetical protein
MTFGLDIAESFPAPLNPEGRPATARAVRKPMTATIIMTMRPHGPGPTGAS